MREWPTSYVPRLGIRSSYFYLIPTNKDLHHLLFAMMLGALTTAPLTLAGCQEEGPGEKIGEGIDEAIEDAHENREP